MKKLFLIIIIFPFLFFSCSQKTEVNIKNEFQKNLKVLVDDLLLIRNNNKSDKDYGAIYCEACKDFHTRAAEAVLPFAVAYNFTKEKKYLFAAKEIGLWLIKHQREDGAWEETPSVWTGTTTDQLLMMAASYDIVKHYLNDEEDLIWKKSIEKAADWLVINMNHVFASINYCATSTATLMVANNVVPKDAYIEKARELADLVAGKFDQDYFLTGEGNRIRGTKYGVDQGYSMDMSLWGMALYAKLAKDEKIFNMVRESLKRYVYFVYPNGSVDGSWGVRASKWTTYGSVTADGCQILFSLFSKENPVYREAALSNMNYMMKMKKDGLLGYGPQYFEMFEEPPCNYPTFCRSKNLAMAILYGDQSVGEAEKLPTQKPSWIKKFETMNLGLVRTNNYMTTVTAYNYKDIRRGADFKYMHRPSGGSITNLWIDDYGFLQLSSQTEYHMWEMHYPDAPNNLPLTPRIEFTDSNAYYTNLYEFDGVLSTEEKSNKYVVSTFGELKDRNRWEGGVAYEYKHEFSDDEIIKTVKLRYHGQKPVVRVIEPFVDYNDVEFELTNEREVKIVGRGKTFLFTVLEGDVELTIGKDKELYNQPFPSVKGFPIALKVIPPQGREFTNTISYKISIVK